MNLRIEAGHIIIQNLVARDVDGARQEILDLVRRTSDGTTIYFDGWKGLGTAPVLTSIMQVLQSMKDPPPELCFGRIIYMDCSAWKSKRFMQRRIAEELELDSNTMALFNKQDMEDDFNGVDPTSRDAIRGVAAAIDRTLRDSSFMMIFLNGSDEEIVLSTLGVPEYHDHVIIWTSKRRFLLKGFIDVTSNTWTKELISKLRYTDIFLGSLDNSNVLTSSEISALVHEEAATILTKHRNMQYDDLAMINNCFLYVLFLHHNFHKIIGWLWAAHGANYWICDGIIQGVRAREISEVLYQELSFEYDHAPFYSKRFKREMMLHPGSSYLVIDDDGDPLWINRKKHCRWISITSRNKIIGENMKSTLATASSVFLLFDITKSPYRLPNDLIQQCINLRVLVLSYCSFNFCSPLFRHCHTLSFLGLDHCRNNNATELLEIEDDITKWACLHSLQVLDLRYTNWDQIFSEEKMDLMRNLMELNIQRSMCWQYLGQLEGRLPYIERLRIIKPLCKVETTSTGTDKSFVGKTKLKVLDLSGNNNISNLPTSISKASSLQVLVLDGCDELENVVLSNSLLRSFSFDGYGPSYKWTSINELPPESSRSKPTSLYHKKDVKTSLISLKGCTQLKNLFLRGLHNLVELDLSGCAIKILDFGTMVVDVPGLKRLFLLGCEYICAIRWGSTIDTSSINETSMTVNLELLCIDTRHGDVRSRPSISQSKTFQLQVHAIIEDARLARSLCAPIYRIEERKGKKFCFDIFITSSNVCDEKTSNKYHVMTSRLYDDVSTKVGDSILTPMRAFPQPPTSRLDCHIEIGKGSYNVETEVEFRIGVLNLAILMSRYAEFLHVHDTSTSTAIPSAPFFDLKWCRVERCPSLDFVFPPKASGMALETIWASDLLMASCIWSKGRRDNKSNFNCLKHLHLRSCSSLQFALPVWSNFSFPSLESIHIIHCGILKHVFALDDEKYDTRSILFPKLTIIHLYDMSALQQICEVKMIAPKLMTIRTRGCWNLRRLPVLGFAGERRRPVVEMEKDVWDLLEWDGVDAGHHQSLYEAPLHSRYYKSRCLLRGTVLR